MPNYDCFSCTRHKELLSLRAQVIHLQNTSECLKQLEETRSKLEKSKKRIDKLNNDFHLLKLENQELKRKKGFYEYKLKQSIKEMDKSFHNEINQKNQEIEELKAEIQKLKAQLKKSSQNSSKPSSQDINRTKIQNNREKTNRKPGGQPGHKGHHLKKMKPTKIITLEAPQHIKNDPNYYKTGKVITKQLVKVGCYVEIIQYETEEYRNKKNYKRVYAEFPKGMINEVTYDASVKALASLLHSHGNMSYDKVKEVIFELTNGQLNISKGTLAVLEKEFSEKTEKERKKIEERLLTSSYMHVDVTTSRVNGKQENVLVATSPAGTMFYQKEHKGFEGLKDTVIEEYEHTLIHDGESTFFKYGKEHQGCLVHELRYLKGSMENEPDLTWALKMRKLLQESIHIVHEALKEHKICLKNETIQDISKRYDEILQLGEEEYKNHPPHKKYYIDGFNTMKRLKKNKEAYLHFLQHIEVPPTNNAAELEARKVKMHSKQSGGYRSRCHAQYYCDTLSLLETNRINNIGRYKTLYEGFSK